MACGVGFGHLDAAIAGIGADCVAAARPELETGIEIGDAVEVEFGGAAQDPWGNTKAGFSASTEIDREDFGLTWNQTLETGGVLISKNIKIEIEVQAVQG